MEFWGSPTPIIFLLHILYLVNLEDPYFVYSYMDLVCELFQFLPIYFYRFGLELWFLLQSCICSSAGFKIQWQKDLKSNSKTPDSTMASRATDSSGGGSLTPSEQSGEERSDHDSDYETDDGEQEEENAR